jgi:cytidylate kinase
MGFLLIVSGPPGAGKSTVSRRLADSFDPSVLVEGDAFFGFLASGAIQPWLPESDAQNETVTEAAAACAGRFARDYATLYDGVVGPWFLPTFARACRLTSVDYVMLLPPVERCLQRVRTRDNHSFSDEGATRKMHHEFASASIADRHVLVDPPLGLDAVTDVILAKRDRGDLVCRVPT